MKIRITSTTIYVGTNWLLVAICFLGALFTGYQAIDGDKGHLLSTPSYPIISISLFVLTIYVSQAIKISKSGIEVYYLGIPFRHIYWNSVSDAVLASFSGKNQKNTLLFLLNHAPKFPKNSNVYAYTRHNWSNCYYIVLPADRVNEAVTTVNNLIEEHINPIVLDVGA